MRLVTIGTGSAAPFVDRGPPAHWVEAGALRLLLDCGPGTLHRCAVLGIPWGDVTHVALTHFHADHCAELPHLLTALRWGQTPGRSTPLTLLGPPGLSGWLARLAGAFGDGVRDPGFPLVVREVTPDETVDLGDGVALRSLPVPHTPESVAYSVARGAARLVYTGDTDVDDALAAWAAGCGVLLAECSLPEAEAIAGHLTPARAGQLAAAVRPGQVVLTHFYPSVLAEDIVAQLRAYWDGPCTVATDGRTFLIEE
jgi:ribonuclease BN (tRNA processing enzyme)